jgi:hypothetical protein
MAAGVLQPVFLQVREIGPWVGARNPHPLFGAQAALWGHKRPNPNWLQLYHLECVYVNEQTLMPS